MNQSKVESFFETCTQTLIRLPVNYCLALIVYPMLGWPVTHGTALGATLIFTISSLILGFTIRRFFNNGMHRIAKELALKWMGVFGK